MLALSGMDWLAVVLATIASMAIGFVWFGPAFGKKWAKEMDMEDAEGNMGLALGLHALGSFVMAFVLWHSIVVWMPEEWAAHFNAGATNSNPAMYALMGAGFVWAGFFVPMQLGRVAWEGRTWTLFAINAGHDLVRLLVMAFLIAFMH